MDLSQNEHGRYEERKGEYEIKYNAREKNLSQLVRKQIRL
jgi:hypothetical protein